MTERPDDRPAAQPISHTLDENVSAIKAWEESALHGRSRAERMSEWITSTAGRGPVLLLHAVWFGFWAAANSGALPWIRPFDPFPFPLLTTMVSLEAIFLALFVLSSQNRLATQADKRAHLDLQIDLLAEREMTAVLQIVQNMARKMGVEYPAGTPHIQELTKETDVKELASKLDEEIPATGGP